MRPKDEGSRPWPDSNFTQEGVADLLRLMDEESISLEQIVERFDDIIAVIRGERLLLLPAAFPQPNHIQVEIAALWRIRCYLEARQKESEYNHAFVEEQVTIELMGLLPSEVWEGGA